MAGGYGRPQTKRWGDYSSDEDSSDESDIASDTFAVKESGIASDIITVKE